MGCIFGVIVRTNRGGGGNNTSPALRLSLLCSFTYLISCDKIDVIASMLQVGKELL